VRVGNLKDDICRSFASVSPHSVPSFIQLLEGVS
jgi:hypothetical protein